MFQSIHQSTQSSDNSEDDIKAKKESILDPNAMMHGLNRSMQMGGPQDPANSGASGIAQAMFHEEDEKPAQMKTIQKAEEEEEVQMKESSADSAQSAASGSSTQSSLPRDVNARMEASFNTNFSNVNIHTNDSTAAQMKALAFTQGNNVHFAPGQYNPHTSKGQELIGHEYTHVVQQGAGRVAPTRQAKGMSINDNPALEHEADVMGKKAAEGKSVDVNGVGSGVQKKEGLAGKIPSTFEGLDVIGYEIGEWKNKGLIGDGYSRRLLLAGDAASWKKILNKYANRYGSLDEYVLPFLGESTGSYWGINDKPRHSDFANWESKKYRNVEEPDKLEFLKALYDTDSSTESTVDLPNSVWEADSNVMRVVNKHWEGLAQFIAENQHLVIEFMSSKQIYFNRSDIESFVEQGHTDGQAIANTPYVVEAMVENAVSTAINAVKSAMSPSEDEYKKNKQSKLYIDMVRNSALIAGSAINQYGADLKTVGDGAGKVFDILWDIIPFAGTLTNIVAGEAKDVLKDGFNDVLLTSGKYSDTKELKIALANKFDEETNKLSNLESEIYIDSYQLSLIQSLFRQFLSE